MTIRYLAQFMSFVNLSALILAIVVELSPYTGILPQGSVRYVFPVQPRVAVSDNTMNVVVWVDTASISQVKIYSPWDTTIVFDISSKSDRNDLIRDMASRLPAELLMDRATLTVSAFHQDPQSIVDSIGFARKETVRQYVLQDTARPLSRMLRDREGTYGVLEIAAWMPTTIVTAENKNNCRGGNVAASVHLHPDVNFIPIEYYSSSHELYRVDSLWVFYALELGSVNKPDGFDTQQFHTPSNESTCQSCHGAIPVAKSAESTLLKCETCHSAMTKQKNVHGLLGSGECSTCHDDKPGAGYKRTYALDAENEMCFKCHDGVAKLVKEKPNVHAPVVGGQCSICHSPHASPFSYQLRKSINEVCYSCHDDKKEGNHPVVFHPSRYKADPRNPEKDLSCASCHNPHASENKSFLNVPGGYFALCQQCHKK
jgi:predicted CXXCH cytochrome family protein